MRLFLALDVDEGVRTAAAAWMSELKRHIDVHASGLRFARLDALHVTLHFLGDVSVASVDGLRQALAERLPIPAFDATLEDTGTFPPRGSPRVVWAGLVAGRHEAVAVHDALIPRLQSAGVQPAFEPRGYVPHLTLARLRPTPDRGRTLLRALAAVPPPRATWTIDHVTLYESDLSENRAKYAIRASTPLA
jgi:RNA 2',3'-cyclic 3'-phosphodiesterase